jgi:hypothetical protein
LIVIIIFN